MISNVYENIDLVKAIREKQVLLIRLPKSRLDQNANLVGSLLITGLRQAALGLNLSGDKHQHTALYVDEFDHLIAKDTIEAMTTEKDKLQIGLVATTKTLQTLPEDFREKMLLNFGSIIVFSVCKKDADVVGPQIFRVDGRKLKHLHFKTFQSGECATELLLCFGRRKAQYVQDYGAGRSLLFLLPGRQHSRSISHAHEPIAHGGRVKENQRPATSDFNRVVRKASSRARNRNTGWLKSRVFVFSADVCTFFAQHLLYNTIGNSVLLVRSNEKHGSQHVL